MPLHRQKTPIQKMNRQLVFFTPERNPFSNKRWIYITSSIVAVVMVAGVTAFAINRTLGQKANPQVAAVQEKADGSLALDNTNSKAQEAEDAKTPETTPTTPIEAAPVVEQAPVLTETVKAAKSSNSRENVTVGEINCSFTYTSSNNTAIKTGVDSNIFWVPNEDCKSNDVLLMQVSSTKPSSNPADSEVTNLDGGDASLIIYWADKRSKSDIDFSKYLVPLTRVGSTPRLYFNSINAYDKVSVGSKTNYDTYYLDGNCDGNGDLGCNLWQLPAKQSVVKLVKRNIVETGSGQANQLKTGQNLKFAKTQDKANSLILTLKVDNSNIKVFYLDIKDTSKVLETQNFASGSASYKKYSI